MNKRLIAGFKPASRMLFMSQVQLVLSLLVFCAIAQQPTMATEVWRPLEQGNVEHAAIMSWHRALLANDYEAYRRLTPTFPELKPSEMKAYFNNYRKSVPPTIVISPESTHVGPNGVKEYAVAGCMKLNGDPREVRMVALVMPAKQNGIWTVFGTAFSTPWNNTSRLCPVK